VLRLLVNAIAYKGFHRLEIPDLDLEDDGAIGVKIQTYLDKRYPGYVLDSWWVCHE
jgi:hypothetical protein